MTRNQRADDIFVILKITNEMGFNLMKGEEERALIF